MHILLIEDEKKTAAFLEKGLREAGYGVEVARDGDAERSSRATGRFDLLIIDVMLPKKDGWTIVQELRAAKIRRRSFFSRRAIAFLIGSRGSSSARMIIW